MVTAEVIERARTGDRDALATIFRAEHAGVLRYLRAMAVAHADDVASQVWVDAARSLHRFQGDATDLRRWLFTIARRRMIDAFRSRARRPEDAVGVPATRAVTEGADAAIDRRAWAEDVLQQLPPAQAEVVMLRVVAGLDVAEVARIVDRSPGAVRVLCHRGLTRVLEILTRDGTVPADLAKKFADGVTEEADPAMVRMP